MYKKVSYLYKEIVVYPFVNFKEDNKNDIYFLNNSDLVEPIHFVEEITVINIQYLSVFVHIYY